MLSKAAILSLGLLVATSVPAHDYSQGDLEIEHPWSRPTPPGTPVGVGYMTIRNHGAQTLTLTGGDTPAAERVTIHRTVMQDGLMKMQPLADGLTVPAGAAVTLKPHSYHLMLEQLKGPLVEGQEIPLSLTFEGLEPVHVKLIVEQPESASAKEHSDH